MEKRINNIVDEALRVFEKNTGFEAQLQTEHLNDTKYPDGLVQIAGQSDTRDSRYGKIRTVES